MSGGGGQDKTENATPKRQKQNRKDGALQRSQDVSAWLGMGAAGVMLSVVLTAGSEAAVDQLQAVRDVVANPDPALALRAVGDGLGSVLLTVAPLMAVVVVAAIVSAAAQGGLHISTKKLKPTFKPLNILAGLKRLVGVQTWWQGGKSLLKTVVIGVVLTTVVQSITPILLASGGLSLHAVLDVAGNGIATLMRTAVVAGIGLAIVDVIFVGKQNRKKTKMTLKEVKDENKNSEGDPLLKGAIRSKQLAMSRNRMMAAIGDADVVLVNPTHVAVALRYEPGTGAPRVVAKGAGHVAARIRAEANDKRVPLVEDIPLARALHAACELGQEIPAELFTQVAKVLAFVMALRRRGAAQGTHRVPETSRPQPSRRAA
ncbi:EscU/YscU/HrcU family type III secretion system export apparatus switch protein [Cellulomonas sp. ATA003]|uniref:EscU/YscU/HrcU family type III secretion system export apparatus switch protein n=1 Tax=Cellulomonas sp. ATA003 TaxID=3073064 RepID=UPI002873D632|nr:EscU/YscU/HrcU family type III secretion system export apparatus switch protein [Cellulomonas sp. ATA003]WNB85227.1 EscU/YscU/HrcU family type III secretion system export apparatus switch protein [Cellulomonas sp. ATA003]